MLWIVGTPIGNLGDVSKRAIEALQRCSYVLCEDTRRTRGLLEHLGIKKRLVAHHKFNEKKSVQGIVDELKEGKEIALVSDAGMPCISDPGEELVSRCQKEGISLSVVPGPCAAILALVLSGFTTHPFQFVGFLEKKEGALTKQLLNIFHYEGTSVAYETPHRIEKTLKLVKNIAPKLQLCVCREITKLHEHCLLGTADNLLENEEIKNPRGEFVLVFSKHALSSEWEKLSGKEHVAILEEEYGISKQDALKLAASMRNTSKKNLYSEIHEN